MTPPHLIEQFMRESNLIEGEFDWDGHHKVGRINKGDMDGAKKFLALKKLTEKSLLSAHKAMFGHRMEDAGSYRMYNVRVGKYFPPDWKDVKTLMHQFWLEFSDMDAWQAHNAFEKIHPFGDGNGRMGRLLWLWKMLKNDSYSFQISFLHLYYYQTLGHVNEQGKKE